MSTCAPSSARVLILCAVVSAGVTACKVDSNPATNPQAPPAIGSLQVVGCDSGIRVQFVGELDPKSVTARSFFVQGVPGLTAYDFAGRVATFVPAMPLLSGNSYSAVLTTEITSIGGTNLEGTLVWSFACVDKTPPAVASKSPIGNGISPLVQPTVVFSKALNPISVTPQTFSITGVVATPTYDAATNTVTLAPAKPLYPGRTYTVTVAPGVQDAVGNGLGVGISWSFQTRPAKDDWAVRVITPPIPTSAPCDTPLQLRFAPSFEVDTTDLGTSPVSIDGAAQLSSTYDAMARVLNVTAVDTPLRPAASYPVLSNGGLRDVSGDRPFDDGEIVTEIDVVPTCSTPTVALVPDASGSIACTASTSMSFSVPMDPTVSAAAISLEDLTQGGYDPTNSPVVASVVTFDAANLHATIMPSAPLKDGHEYWLSVSTAAHDLATPPSALVKSGGWVITASCP